MSVNYMSVPEGYDFSTEFPTYIIAFCPDSDSWFVTNQRFFFYEYPMEFPDEQTAISYFKGHTVDFYNEEIRMGVYRPTFYAGGVYFENENRLIDCR